MIIHWQDTLAVKGHWLVNGWIACSIKRSSPAMWWSLPQIELPNFAALIQTCPDHLYCTRPETHRGPLHGKHKPPLSRPCCC